MALMVAVGSFTVPVPGTAVQVTVPVGLAGPTSPGLTSAHAIIIQALPTNVGKVWIGTKGIVKTGYVNVLQILPIPTGNLIPSFSMAIALGANSLGLTDLWIDADIGNDGVLIAALVG
jgi:hypothetical protein